ncbi:MAG: asparaginase [Chloroflexota bacterium]
MSTYNHLLELTRGEIVESVHSGAIAVVDVHGKLVAWHGDPQIVTYLRSSAKPFQALPFLEHGGQAAYGLTEREIALICASHSGTEEHVALVRQIQAKTGVLENDLLCGTHNPYHRPTAEAMRQRGEKPTPNRHNCSGKHTGMIAHARLHNLPYADYIDPAHPIQQEILQIFAEMCAIEVQQVQVGIDGCSAPNFAVPLYNAALGMARLLQPDALPSARADQCNVVTAAMFGHPDMVGGPDAFDTHLMQQTGGRILAKSGAEGYLVLGIAAGGSGLVGSGSGALGVAIKVADGDLRGSVRPAVALEILRQLDAITTQELDALSAYGPQFALYNWRRLRIGEAHACFELQR